MFLIRKIILPLLGYSTTAAICISMFSKVIILDTSNTAVIYISMFKGINLDFSTTAAVYILFF